MTFHQCWGFQFYARLMKHFLIIRIIIVIFKLKGEPFNDANQRFDNIAEKQASLRDQSLVFLKRKLSLVKPLYSLVKVRLMSAAFYTHTKKRRREIDRDCACERDAERGKFFNAKCKSRNRKRADPIFALGTISFQRATPERIFRIEKQA